MAAMIRGKMGQVLGFIDPLSAGTDSTTLDSFSWCLNIQLLPNNTNGALIFQSSALNVTVANTTSLGFKVKLQGATNELVFPATANVFNWLCVYQTATTTGSGAQATTAYAAAGFVLTQTETAVASGNAKTFTGAR